MIKSLEYKTKKKLHEIAETILHEKATQDLGLLGGASGILMFKVSYNKHIGYQFFDIEQDIQNIFEKINNQHVTPLYSNGLAGIGWVFLYLIQNNIIESDKSQIQDINQFLEQQLIQQLEVDNYDYLHGAIGIAIYLLKFGENQELISNVIKVLEKKALTKNNGIYWETKSIEGKKHVNFGLAHGLNSFIMFFCLCIRENIEKVRSTEMALKAVNYINQFKFSSPISNSSYPITNEDKFSSTPGRLGWCYGDLGFAVAQYKLGTILNKSDLIESAIFLLKQNLKRVTPDETQIVDAGICHGSAGVAYIYNKLFLCTKEEDFNIISKYWLNETIKMAVFEDGLAGYKSWSGEVGYKKSLGFLDGISGIGLVFISFLSNDKAILNWDESLLL